MKLGLGKNVEQTAYNKHGNFLNSLCRLLYDLSDIFTENDG